MGIFGKLSNEGLEEAQDRAGGGGFQHEADIYNSTVEMAYAGESAGGAMSVSFIFDLGDNRKHRETFYVTNKKKENFYLNKNDNTKKVPLPGFVSVDDICMATTEKSLAEQDTEEKIVKIWDFDAKAEVPKSVPVLVDVIGKPVSIALLKILRNKREQASNGDYVDVAGDVTENQVDKVFHTESRMTMVEARRDAALIDEGKEPLGAQFWDTWLTNNKGKVRDKRSIKDGGSGGTSGRPGGNAGAPTGGAPASERKSLFNKS
jgi:hypothetical protein